MVCVPEKSKLYMRTNACPMGVEVSTLAGCAPRLPTANRNAIRTRNPKVYREKEPIFGFGRRPRYWDESPARDWVSWAMMASASSRIERRWRRLSLRSRR